MDITLKRLTLNSIGPTYGVLFNGTTPLCLTLERPWQDNQADISCIPPGTYQCIPHNSPDHPNTWEISNVPNRSEILIHFGNYVSNSSGCVLVGNGFITNGIGDSQVTLNALRQTLPQNFTLEIINP